MTDKWVVDDDHPDGYAVPMTDEEQEEFDAFQAEAAAEEQTQATRDGNAAAMGDKLQAQLQQALQLADALDAGNATAAQQRQAVALCLRGLVRNARLTLKLYDDAP